MSAARIVKKEGLRNEEEYDSASSRAKDLIEEGSVKAGASRLCLCLLLFLDASNVEVRRGRLRISLSKKRAGKEEEAVCTFKCL